MLFRSEIAADMEELMSSIQSRFDTVAHRDGDSYTLSGDGINGIDEAFGAEFEREVEELVARSLGSIIAMVGQAMASGEGTFEQRMEQFGQKMENLGERVEQDMEHMGGQLEAASAEVCGDILQIAAMEEELRSDIPELGSYQLFTPEHIRSR